LNASENNPAPEGISGVLEEIRGNGPFMRELAELLEQAQADRSGARCLGGGACCRFDLVEHRLYLTLGELALLTQPPLPDLAPAARRRCRQPHEDRRYLPRLQHHPLPVPDLRLVDLP
jgi:hypothetical protein